MECVSRNQGFGAKKDEWSEATGDGLRWSRKLLCSVSVSVSLLSSFSCLVSSLCTLVSSQLSSSSFIITWAHTYFEALPELG